MEKMSAILDSACENLGEQTKLPPLVAQSGGLAAMRCWPTVENLRVARDAALWTEQTEKYALLQHSRARQLSCRIVPTHLTSMDREFRRWELRVFWSHPDSQAELGFHTHLFGRADVEKFIAEIKDYDDHAETMAVELSMGAEDVRRWNLKLKSCPTFFRSRATRCAP